MANGIIPLIPASACMSAPAFPKGATMKVSLARLAALSILVISWSACGDDDPTAPTGGSGGSKPFNTSNMPLSVPTTINGSGNLNFDASGNIIVATGGGNVYSVSRSTGEIATVANTVAGGARLMCCVFDKNANRIYACTDANPTSIYTINPSNGASTLLVSLPGGYGQQMNFVPTAFGAHAGELLVQTYSNGLYAIDPSSPGSPTVTYPQSGTDMEFGPDGTLYVADYDNDRIVTVSSAGAVVEFAPMVAEPEGIAINASGTKMYVASVGSPSRIYEVTMPAGTATPLADRTFTSGSYPTGMLIDGHGHLIFVTAGSSEMVIDFLTL